MSAPLGRRPLLLGLAAILLSVPPSGPPASAQTLYPARPVTLVVPFAAGGPTDTIARLIVAPMARALGQPIQVQNITGAGGTNGITQASQAPADGYTIMMGHMGTHGAAPALFRGLKYDPTRTFDPIGVAAGTPIVLVARKDFPARDLKGFIDAIGTEGAAIHQAQAGIGSVSHSAGVLFDTLAGAQPTQVVYRGTGPAVTDLIAGQVDFMTDQIVNVAPHVQAGTIRAYAVATRERSAVLPGVPTTREAGLPGFEVSAWNALFAPKGLPDQTRARLVEALDKALDDAAVRKRISDLGGQVPSGAERGPAALQRLVESEVARWTPVLRAAVESRSQEDQ